MRSPTRYAALLAIACAGCTPGAQADVPEVVLEEHPEPQGEAGAANEPHEEATLDEVVEPAPEEATAFDPLTAEWREDERRCRRRGRRFYCDGPRRVPRAHGEAAERATRLGFGTKQIYWRLFSRPAEPELLQELPVAAEDTLLWPVPEGYYGRGFGRVRERANVRHVPHKGVDIPAAEGSEVRATNAGIVFYADNSIEGYGNLVTILHSDNTITKYAHLQAAYVFAGQLVTRGQAIGEVGKTGLARAPHLHFEWHVRSHPRNPRRVFADVPSRERSRELQRAQAERAERKRAVMHMRQSERERRQLARGEPWPPVEYAEADAEPSAPAAETVPVARTVETRVAEETVETAEEAEDFQRAFDLPPEDDDFQRDMDLETTEPM